MAHECKICSRKFPDASILHSHLTIHLGRKCKHCDQRFQLNRSATDIPADITCHDAHSWLALQSKHIAVSTPCIASTPMPVISIPRSDYDRNTVSLSNMVSPNEWQCSFCAYKTISRGRLTKHMRTHTNERPYRCDECGKRFTVQCNLKQHILSIHVKQKPFKCAHCDLSFIRKDKLREHERVHTGERPFGCSYCQLRFARRSTMNKHLRTHTGFDCRFCGATLPTEQKLRAHKRELHQDVSVFSDVENQDFRKSRFQKSRF